MVKCRDCENYMLIDVGDKLESICGLDDNQVDPDIERECDKFVLGFLMT